MIFPMIFTHRNRSRKRWDSPNRDFVRHVFWRLFPVAKKPRKKYSIHHFYRKWAKEYDGLFKKIILVSLVYQKCEKLKILYRFPITSSFLDAFPVLFDPSNVSEWSFWIAYRIPWLISYKNDALHNFSHDIYPPESIQKEMRLAKSLFRETWLFDGFSRRLKIL